MIYHYPNFPDYSAQVSYHRNKVGPNYFVVYYKGISRMAFDRVSVKRCFGSARFLDSTKALGLWCDEMISKYGSTDDNPTHPPADGFGPECHEDTSPTKMII